MALEKAEKTEVYRFSKCIIDADRRELTVDGNIVTLQPKAFELLLYLVRNRHRAVDKDELQDALWPRSIVTETALTRCVMKARRAVGDDAETQAVIKTVHGHGYRFTASIDSGSQSQGADVAARAASANRWRPVKLIGLAATLVATIVVAWIALAPPAMSGPIRLAVLPVENATGNDDMDWVSTGLMVLMNRMLEDAGVETVSANSVTSLVDNHALPELLATGSEFRKSLQDTTAATHFVGASLQQSDGLYRLTYTLADNFQRPRRRTIVGKEPTKLIKDVVDTVAAMITMAPIADEANRSVSNDEFLNEAYARSMALFHEGRYADAIGLFDVIIEQEPHLFWPRYERALALRNMREFDAAERELLALRDDTRRKNMISEQAGVENALGIIYMSHRRHAEAQVAFDASVALATSANEPMRIAAGYQNLGLLEKNKGNIEAAYDYLRLAEKSYRDADIRVLPGNIHNNLAGALIQMGQFEAAEQQSLQAVSSFQLAGQRLFESYALNRLSDIYARQRRYDEAMSAAESALSVREELNDAHGIGSSKVTLADIAALRGDHTRALQYARQAKDIGVDIDSKDIVASAMVRIARAEMRLGNLQAAADEFAMLESIARTNDDGHNVFRSQMGRAQVLTKAGDLDGAMAIGNQMLLTAREINRRRDETAALRIIADVQLANDRIDDAIENLKEAQQIAIDIGDSVVQASLHTELAEAYLANDDAASAEPHVAAAAVARPEDASTLRIQALLAAQQQELDDAVRLMGLARGFAGESWSDDDEALLVSYREQAARRAQ